jgi:heme-degrading monooxygenase HmoA
MWNVKASVIQVITGATETISKSFRKYVSTIPGNQEVKELQKTAILGTAHILRKVLM